MLENISDREKKLLAASDIITTKAPSPQMFFRKRNQIYNCVQIFTSCQWFLPLSDGVWGLGSPPPAPTLASSPNWWPPTAHQVLVQGDTVPDPSDRPAVRVAREHGPDSHPYEGTGMYQPVTAVTMRPFVFTRQRTDFFPLVFPPRSWTNVCGHPLGPSSPTSAKWSGPVFREVTARLPAARPKSHCCTRKTAAASASSWRAS